MKVAGARRIWNTLPTCSAKAIATTISKVIPTKLDLRVKRKTKNITNNSKTVWWFVVHGSESDLTILEHDWDKVYQQTLWSLQNCYMTTTLPNSNESAVITPAANSHTQPPPSPTSSSTNSGSEHQPSNSVTINNPTASESILQFPLVHANSPSKGTESEDNFLVKGVVSQAQT